MYPFTPMGYIMKWGLFPEHFLLVRPATWYAMCHMYAVNVHYFFPVKHLFHYARLQTWRGIASREHDARYFWDIDGEIWINRPHPGLPGLSLSTPTWRYSDFWRCCCWRVSPICWLLFWSGMPVSWAIFSMLLSTLSTVALVTHCLVYCKGLLFLATLSSHLL